MTDFAVRFPNPVPLHLPLRAAHARPDVPALLQTAEDGQYRELQHAFRPGGGIASADEVTNLLRWRTDQPISVLARWIVDHRVLSFDWQSLTMLPLFQFDLSTMTLREPVSQVIRELVPALGGWDVALWFARPNAWLEDASPIVAIHTDARAVYDAARADRFVARG
ncbi:MAG: hypothetical protein JWQ76_2441 [Ramlibacter sp.]|nr:hypothetical protein [Ramlibacter sp.]